MKVIIIGGGIGGLTLGQSFKRIGIRFKIYEQTKNLQPVGGGLGLWRNSQWVFQELELLEKLKQHGSWMKFPGYREVLGTYLAKPSIHFEERFPVLCLHRADLQGTLLDGIENQVLTGKKFIRFQELQNSVKVFFEDGSNDEGDLVVGCDGIHSFVRNQLFPVQKNMESYCGYTYYRAALDLPNQNYNSPEFISSFETWGEGKRFGYVPLKSPQVFWFASIPTQSLTEIDMKNQNYDSTKSQLLQIFKSWHNPISYLIDSTHSSQIIRTDIYKIPTLSKWYKGRIVLLGDACHAAAPNLAQGAGLAIEDALQLAKAIQKYISGQSSLDHILSHDYEKLRIPRAQTVQIMADIIASVGQISNPFLIFIRNTIMKMVPFPMKSSMFEFLVRYSLGWNYDPPLLISNYKLDKDVLVFSFWKRLIGYENFALLPKWIQHFRESASGGSGKGWCKVVLGNDNSWMYRMIGKIAGLPPPNPHTNFEASVQVLGEKQIWRRVFDTHPFETEMSIARKNGVPLLKERIGILSFLYKIKTVRSNDKEYPTLFYQSCGAQLFGIHIPSFIQPKSSWEEIAIPEGWSFRGKISFPLLGQIFVYQGEFFYGKNSN